MSLQKLIANYGNFNYWANKELTDWLKSQDNTLLSAQLPSSFPSIDYTLQHMLRTQRFWLAFITEQDLSGFSWKPYDNRAETITNELVEQSAEMKTAFAAFKEEDLLKVLHLDMPWAKNERCRYDYIIHVVNHSTFHRGQIVTMARSLGITGNIPATDYNIYNCNPEAL